jgi:tetratricopeptide (TPR) repeat protein
MRLTVLVLILAAVLANIQDPTSPIRGMQQSDVELMPDDTTKVRLMTDLSMANLRTNSSVAVDYAQQALALARQIGDEAAIDRSLQHIIVVTFHAGLYGPAAGYMNEVLNRFIARKDYLQAGRYYFNLGSVYNMTNDLTQAETYIMKGWKMIDSVYTALGRSYDKVELASIYNNLAYLKWSQQQVDEAERYYRMGLELGNMDEIGSQNFKTINLGLVNVHFKRGELDQVKPLLDAVLDVQQAENDAAGMGMTYRMLGNYYQLQDRFPQAIQYYMDAWSQAVSTRNVTLSENVAGALHKAYETLGVADSALKYLNLVNTFKEELRVNEARQELLRAELTREYEAREQLLQQAGEAKSNRLTVILFVVAITTLISIWLFIRSRKKYRESEQERLHIEEVAQQSEQEAEVLKADLERKDKELTTLAIYSIQKNEKISELVEKLQSKNPEDLVSQAGELRKIIKALEKTTDQGIWEEFELRFQQVHSGFYERLLEAYPSLSLNERRVCAFLRLDMTTKEIASITGQTVRAVELTRIRLRKKMNLTNSDQSLYEVLSVL